MNLGQASAPGIIDFILDRNNQKNKLAQVISSLMSNYNSEKKS